MKNIKNIYVNNKLKYPLNDDEYDKLDEVWKLINILSTPFVFISDYRNYLLNTIRENYTMKEFFVLETVINKLFWNLRWAVFPFFIKPKLNEENYDKFINDNYGEYDEIPNSLLLCDKIKYDNDDDLDKKIKNITSCNTYYRSFINKLIIIDKDNKVFYHKKMEGSSEIFSKNFFNLYTTMILFNRDLYEKIMRKPIRVKKYKIELSNYYHQYDYCFPNLNYCVYSIGDDEYKIDRIKKIYYNGENDFKYWHKLI